MTEKERDNAAKEAYKAIKEAEMNVFEMRSAAEDEVNLGLRVKYAPGKGFNQLNFIPL